MTSNQAIDRRRELELKFLEEYPKTGPGTKAGKMLRCYWHPVCLSKDLRDIPYAVRMLGEDLVAFRLAEGSVGLVGRQCPHRCASLEYGQIRERGLQCSYHGWTFDLRGNCIDMPLERAAARAQASISHTWYPTQEWGGIVWCYMGEEKTNPPPLPKIDLLDRDDGELFLERGTYGVNGSTEGMIANDVRNYNYLSFLENILDLGHLSALHGLVPTAIPDYLKPYCDTSVDLDFRRVRHEAVETSYGIKAIVVHDTGDPGIKFMNTFSVALPAFYRFSSLSGRPIDCTNDRRESGGILRIIDDQHFEIIRFSLVRRGNAKQGFQPRRNGASASQGLTGVFEPKPYDHRKYPAWEGNVVLEDLVIQESQGAIPRRQDEHLASSDIGVSLMRKVWRQSMEAVERGEKPKQVVFDNRGVFDVDTFKGFVKAEDVKIGPDNMPSSRNGGGLIRDAENRLVFG